MKNKKLRIILAMMLCLILLGAMAVAVACNPTEDEPEAFDYYKQTYGVESGHVFETINFTDMITILTGVGKYNDDYTVVTTDRDGNSVSTKVNKPGQTGTFSLDGKVAILWGGPWDNYTKAIMSEVNTAAKAKGVKKVYVMDTYYDSKIGETLDPIGYLTPAQIAAVSEQTNVGASKVNPGPNSSNVYALGGFYGLAGMNSMFSADGQKPADVFGTPGEYANSALLVILDVPYATTERSATNGNQVKILDSWRNTEFTEASKLTAAAKTKIADVLGKIGDKEARYDYHVVRNGAHLWDMKDFDGENEYFQQVNYAEFLALLAFPGDHVILLGCMG